MRHTPTDGRTRRAHRTERDDGDAPRRDDDGHDGDPAGTNDEENGVCDDDAEAEVWCNCN